MARIWLFGAMTLVIVLVVGGIVVALMTGRGELLPENSPEGVVQRYLLALEDEEYQEAYDYLTSDLRERCSLADFVRSAPSTRVRGNQVTLEDTQTFDDSALVTARITVFRPGDPFSPSEHSYDQTYQLELEAGQWRMAEPDWWCPRDFERE